MPYVHIRVTDEGVSRQQKAQLITAVTGSIVTLLNKKPEQTMVVIEEVPLENWGLAGRTVAELRKEGK